MLIKISNALLGFLQPHQVHERQTKKA